MAGESYGRQAGREKMSREDVDEITTGTLHCGSCDVGYTIADGIPNLLPPEKD